MPSLKGLVLWYTFEPDKIEDSRAKDRSAWENHATLYGPGEVDGKIGKGLSLDGTDDYLDCGKKPSLDFSTEFSLEIWLKSAGTQSPWARVISRGDYRYELVMGGSNGDRAQFQATISDALYYKGIIDEVRLYNRALSDEEVRRHFQEELPAHTREEAENLAGLWIPEISVNTSKLKDLSRWGNHGSIIGASWKWTDPGIWILEFDGVDDYVEVADDPSLKPDDVSFELWVRTSDDVESRQFLMNKYQWIDNAWGIQIFYSKIYIYDDISGVDKAYAAVPIETNTWYHLVATMSSKENRFYLNGELKSSGVYSQNTLATVPGSLFLGQRGGGAYYFKGLIGEARIYSRVLLATEIKDRFESQRSRYGV